MPTIKTMLGALSHLRDASARLHEATGSGADGVMVSAKGLREVANKLSAVADMLEQEIVQAATPPEPAPESESDPHARWCILCAGKGTSLDGSACWACTREST